MASTKRERQRQNRAKKVEEVKVEEVAEERKSRLSSVGILAGVLILIALLFWACSGGDDDESGSEVFATGDETGEIEGSGETTLRREDIEDAVDTDLKPLGPVPDDFVAWSGTRQLSDTTSGLRNGIYTSAPPMVIDTSLTYEAVITTNRGVMRFRLLDDESPMTVNNFVQLANDGYYDGVSFHRVIADFMAQGGDPSGTGAGGPGYQFADEFDNGLQFDKRGQLAMANAGPGTNGSQFFITFVATDFLTGAHTIFGELTEGDDVLGNLRLRDPQTDPADGDIMTSVEIVAS